MRKRSVTVPRIVIGFAAAATGALLVYLWLHARRVTAEEVARVGYEKQKAITRHELSAQRASLEEAYMKLTDTVTEYRAVSQ